jgi:allophanate hydrolase subunit 2
MAIQLSDLLVNNLKPIITSIVMPGTVQLTPAGSLIILMKDCQTTGGYPRILQVEEKSINSLAQLKKDSELSFSLKI